GIHPAKELEKAPEWREILRAQLGPGDRKKVVIDHTPFESLLTSIGLGLVKLMAKVLFRLEVRGMENIPERGPYIIAPNHVSYLDGFCVGASLPIRTIRDLYTLGVQNYFRGIPGKIFARLANVIPIDAEAYLSKALQMSSYVLGKGKALMVFPEGGRSFDGSLVEFKKGVGILSRELNVPVIPTYIAGAFEALPRGAFLPRFRKIRITYGAPLFPSDLDFTKKPEGVDDYQFFANQLRESVRKLGQAVRHSTT
ncbi:MAG: lysophospholipid acyltransferase family protein, partial [Nitrospirota bacterium]